MRTRPPRNSPTPIHQLFFLLAATALSPLPQAPAAVSRVAPVHLWDAMAAASFVVLADVERVTACGLWSASTAPPVCRGDTKQQIAELRLREIWKLDEAWVMSDADLAEVSFLEPVASGQPQGYEPGQQVVAFLRHAGPQCTSWEWKTVDVWPGTLVPGVSEVDGYRDVLLDALRLQSEWPFPRPAPPDWLARAASRLGGAQGAGPGGGQGARLGAGQGARLAGAQGVRSDWTGLYWPSGVRTHHAPVSRRVLKSVKR
ncbi:MAG TPA: hypothetical protein VFQ07_17780 [Candidatus Polarisedimenticolia bacterium]|nr:hypothetical protein [Candidatus Polarisedimenticolia bacterium]